MCVPLSNEEKRPIRRVSNHPPNIAWMEDAKAIPIAIRVEWNERPPPPNQEVEEKRSEKYPGDNAPTVEVGRRYGETRRRKNRGCVTGWESQDHPKFPGDDVSCRKQQAAEVGDILRISLS